MKFKVATGITWWSVYKPDSFKLYLQSCSNALTTTGVQIKVTADQVWFTDLPPLYKKDKAGRWQTMEFSLKLTEGLSMKRRTIKTPGLKTKEYNTPIKVVASKYYSDSIQDQLQSTWNKKHNRDGWLISKDAPSLSEPLLLHHWDQYKDNIRYPACIMPKYNGIRCTYKPHVGLMSRKRNPFKIPHLEEQCWKLGMNVDGELWAPGCTLEEIVSLVANDPTGRLLYMLFNRPQGGTFIDRMAVLLKEVSRDTPNLCVVPIAVVNSEVEAEAAFLHISKMDGVDGAVICNTDYSYEFDIRSKDVLKMKSLITDEFIVTAVGYDDDAIGKLIRFTFHCPGVGPFDYIPAWSKEIRKQRYEVHIDGSVRFIGKLYTLTFRERTAKGLPKHITSILERSYE